MGEKMQHAPIFFTIGQIRFNPILDMHNHVEALQTEFRKNGFSGFNEEALTSIQVDTSSASPKVVPTSQKRWRLLIRKTAEIILFPNSLVYQTTAYETSQDFIGRTVDAIRIVHNKASASTLLNPSDLERSTPSFQAKIIHSKSSLSRNCLASIPVRTAS